MPMFGALWRNPDFLILDINGIENTNSAFGMYRHKNSAASGATANGEN
jgi:hypothetical protein